MPVGWIMAAAAVASVGMGAYSMATAPGAPESPDLSGASRGAVEADAATLPFRRQLEAAARAGQKITIPNYPAHQEQQDFYWVKGGSQYDSSQLDNQKLLAPAIGPDVASLGKLLGKKRTVWNMVPKSEWEKGGKFEGQDPPPWGGGKRTVDIPEGAKTFDFTGYGEADVQGKNARTTAENILKLNDKYGADFIAEALKQEKLADPEGAAAREKLYQLIQEQAGEKPDRPVADLLDSQIKDQLASGKGLDAISDDVLRDAILKAGESRGERYHGADFSEPLTTGFEGQNRLDAGQQKALSWLTSGATPEDVDYRRNQQLMSNLSDFVNGRTPQSQFSSLSGAQNGAAPYAPGPAGPQNNGSTASATQNAAMSNWQSQLQQMSNQADPYMAGLSMVLNGVGAVGSARSTARN